MKKNLKIQDYLFILLILTVTTVFLSRTVIGTVFVNMVTRGTLIGFKLLTPEEARQRWGQRPFDAEQFKRGDCAVQASMVHDMVTNHRLKDIPFNEIRDVLGPINGGYYGTDANPTYCLEYIYKDGQLYRSYHLALVRDLEENRIGKIRIWIDRDEDQISLIPLFWIF